MLCMCVEMVVGVKVGVVCFVCVSRWLCVCDVCCCVVGWGVVFCVYVYTRGVVWLRGVVCGCVVLCVWVRVHMWCYVWCGLCVCVCVVLWCAARLGTRKNPPCVDSTRLRAHRQDASVCTGNRPAC